MLQSILWLSALMLCYTFAGYFVLLRLLAPFGRRHPVIGSDRPQSVSVVIAARGEADRIVGRIRNLFACEAPADQFEVIVVCDGPDAEAESRIESFGDSRARVLALPAPSGKAACLNRGVAAAAGDVVVFADARQEFDSRALVELVAPFADPAVGAVSGALEIAPAAHAVGKGVDAYWRLEKAIRRAEAELDSSIGCTGAIYAIRRRLYRPIPDDTILDDVVIPMQILTQGFRVLFEPAAIAWETQTLEPARERVRKRRTLTGNFQMLCRYPVWLLPSRDRLWWALLSHKYLRLAAPAFLVLALSSSGALAFRGNTLGAIAFIAQALFYVGASLAAVGVCRLRPCAMAAGFTFLNWMVIEAGWFYCFGSRHSVWRPISSSSAERPLRAP